MAANTKNSHTAKNVALGLLSVWSLVSLVTIVVWATSPDLKGSAQCRAELTEMTEKLEGAKVVFSKNKVALEEMVEGEREKQARLNEDILLLLGRLNATNASLEESQQENAVLNANISVMLEDVERLQQREANLTAQLGLKEDHIEALQQNMTQAVHQTESCFNLKEAAHSQMLAAQTQTKACESSQQYLQKQLQKCKEAESEAPQKTHQAGPPPPSPTPSNAAPLAGIPTLTLLIFSTLHLIT